MTAEPTLNAPAPRRRRPRLPRLPRHTLRLRLTVLYSSVFVVVGTLLLAITYAGGSSLSVRRAVSSAAAEGPTRVAHVHPGSTLPPTPITPPAPEPAGAEARQLGILARHIHGSDTHQLLIWSCIALAITALASLVLGWILAGRALRPLQAITSAARAISASNLHERLALDGPNDELRELGDTFDALLERLESAFEAQRRFVANASHELRTPLTLERALLEVTLADPAASSDSLRAACERVLAIGAQQERMLAALLTLARAERGIEHREPVRLDHVTDAILRERREEITRRGLRLDAALDDAPTSGDGNLIELLVANLLDNAIQHNTSEGWIAVSTAVLAGDAVVTVSNSGPAISLAEVERLLQPFRRRGADRIGHGDGHALGLSIVDAIATAHGATLTVQPQPAGGLRIEVRFPNMGVPTQRAPAEP
jgi:signal transduction histidine kinase